VNETVHAPPRRQLRRWLLNLHIYGGLLCSSYLLLYGVTSILANHRPNPLLGVASDRTWTATVAKDRLEGEPLQAARAVADAIGIFGRIAQGEVARSPEGDLRFKAHRPGRDYEVRTAADGSIRVTEHRTRIGALLLGLHDARLERSSAALTSWWYFTAAVVFVLALLAGTGVAVWLAVPRARAAGWRLLLGGPVALVVLLAWMVW